MPQVVFTNSNFDSVLAGVGHRLASQMEQGQRAFIAGAQADSGSMVFQRLPNGVVRVIITPTKTGKGIVGYSYSNMRNQTACTWDYNGKIKLLPTPPGAALAYATCVSADGSTIAGAGYDLPIAESMPTQWVNEQLIVMPPIPPLPNSSPLTSFEFASISLDGSATCYSGGDGPALVMRRDVITNDYYFTLLPVPDPYNYASIKIVGSGGGMIAGVVSSSVSGEQLGNNTTAVVWNEGIPTILPLASIPSIPMPFYVSASTITAASADTTILGGSTLFYTTIAPYTTTAVPCRWVNGAVEPLESIPPNTQVYVLGMSSDGLAVVGYAGDPANTGNYFVWDNSPPLENSTATNMNAFIWTAGTPATPTTPAVPATFSVLPNAMTQAFYISADKTVVAGVSYDTSGLPHACQWTVGVNTNLTLLPEPSGTVTSVITAASSDLSVLAGTYTIPNGEHACAWVNGNLVILQEPVGSTNSTVAAVAG